MSKPENTNCLYCGRAVEGLGLFPFCNNHYFAIPRHLRKYLYQGQSAWQAALEWLEHKYGKWSVKC